MAQPSAARRRAAGLDVLKCLAAARELFLDPLDGRRRTRSPLCCQLLVGRHTPQSWGLTGVTGAPVRFPLCADFLGSSRVQPLWAIFSTSDVSVNDVPGAPAYGSSSIQGLRSIRLVLGPVCAKIC